jgi:serine/threonine protein kinase
LIVAIILVSPLLCSTASNDHDAELKAKASEWVANPQAALSKYGPIGEWDTSKVQSTAGLFLNAAEFDEDLNRWDVSGVTNAGQMFQEATMFTSDLSSWNVSAARDFSWMFSGASHFASDISAWSVSSVASFAVMFSRAAKFNSDLSSWDMSAATQTSGMFNEAASFTSNLSAWDVSKIDDMNYMFAGAAQFTTKLASWQVQYTTSTVGLLPGTRLLLDYGTNLPCWASVGPTAAACPVPVTLSGSRLHLSPVPGVTTVDPTEMSETNPYRVGTTYRIAPLVVTVEPAHLYSLVDAPDGFYINPETGVVLGAFGPDDVTFVRQLNGTSSTPFSATLQVVAQHDNGRAAIETYTMHVDHRDMFDLVRGDSIINEKYSHEYLDDRDDEAVLVLVDVPFRVAARTVDRQRTVLSFGGFDDITYTFKVIDTVSGNLLSNELDRVSIKPNGELLGEFSTDDIGKLTIIVTAADGGGERVELKPLRLDVRQLDVDNPSFGPNKQGCHHNGVPIDDSADLYDGIFTSCDCANLRYFGENCENECTEGTTKDPNTGQCFEVDRSPQPTSNTISSLLAAVAGTCVLLLLLVAVAVRYREYKRSIRPVNFDELNKTMIANGTVPIHSECKPRELKRSNVVLLEQVGQGAFGAVWKAMLDESSTTGSPEYQVAAKTVKGDSAEGRVDLTTEAVVMAQLAGHRNLVSIIGVVTSGNPLILVLSYCDHGSMLGHLKKKIAAGNAASGEHKLDFAAQTAKGMAHLSGRNFIHRDLAARNVLLTSGQSASNLVCKVADFGLSRVGNGKQAHSTGGEDYYRSQKGVFPVRWTAPEAMETLVFNQASDVWSFGVVLIELAQDGDQPYHSLRGNGDVVALTMSGKRHQQPPRCSTGLYAIMLRCWDSEPANRPTFTALALELEQLSTRATLWGEDLDDCAEEGSVESTVPDGELHAAGAASCIIEEGAVCDRAVDGDSVVYELESAMCVDSSGSSMYARSSEPEISAFNRHGHSGSHAQACSRSSMV